MNHYSIHAREDRQRHLLPGAGQGHHVVEALTHLKEVLQMETNGVSRLL